MRRSTPKREKESAFGSVAVALAVYLRKCWRPQALPHLEKDTRQNYERAWLKWIKAEPW